MYGAYSGFVYRVIGEWLCLGPVALLVPEPWNANIAQRLTGLTQASRELLVEEDVAASILL